MGKRLSKNKGKPAPGAKPAAPAAAAAKPAPAAAKPKKTADERRNERLAEDCEAFSTGAVANLFSHFSNLAAASPEVGTRCISRAQFEGALAEQGIDFKSNAFAGRMFVAFDQKKTNTIDFTEFVLGLNALSEGGLREKLQLSFVVYDIDNTGKISRDELAKVLGDFLGEDAPDAARADIGPFVDDIMAKCDKTKSGSLGYLEYMKACMRFPQLVDFDASSQEKARAERERALRRERAAREEASGTTAVNVPTQAAAAPPDAPASAADSKTQVRSLARKSAFTTGQVATLYAHFSNIAAASPEVGTRRISRAQFEGALEGQGIDFQSNAFASRLFAAFDKDKTQTIDFTEFVLGLNALSEGTAREKLQLSFDLYDVDCSGKITRAEMTQVLLGVRGGGEAEASGGGGGAARVAEGREKAARAFVNRVFDSCDVTGDGKLNYVEYMRGAMKFPGLVKDVLG